MSLSRTVLTVAVTTLALGGCATLSVSSYVERGIDVRQYRSFGWDSTEGLYTGDPRLDNNRFFDERVRTAVAAGLAARGFDEAVDAPDLLIRYHASVTQRLAVSRFDRESGACENASCRPDVYEAGTLVVDLVDRRSRRLIWRGWAEGAIDNVIDNQQLMEEKVGEAVGRILERLPQRL